MNTKYSRKEIQFMNRTKITNEQLFTHGNPKNVIDSDINPSYSKYSRMRNYPVICELRLCDVKISKIIIRVKERKSAIESCRTPTTFTGWNQLLLYGVKLFIVYKPTVQPYVLNTRRQEGIYVQRESSLVIINTIYTKKQRDFLLILQRDRMITIPF